MSDSTLAQRVSSTGIEWRVSLPFTIAALAGVSVGTRLGGKLPSTTLARGFVGLLVVIATYTALRSALAT